MLSSIRERSAEPAAPNDRAALRRLFASASNQSDVVQVLRDLYANDGVPDEQAWMGLSRLAGLVGGASEALRATTDAARVFVSDASDGSWVPPGIERFCSAMLISDCLGNGILAAETGAAKNWLKKYFATEPVPACSDPQLLQPVQELRFPDQDHESWVFGEEIGSSARDSVPADLQTAFVDQMTARFRQGLLHSFTHGG